MYRLLPQYLDREELLSVRGRMVARHLVYSPQKSVYARSGFTLEGAPWLFAGGGPLDELLAEANLACGLPMRFVPEWSSCQLVRPDSGLEFPWHQDVAALGITKPDEKGGIFWIPLDDLTGRMPALAVFDGHTSLLAHVDDGRGVSIIDPMLKLDGFFNEHRIVYDNLRIGDVVFMDAFQVHETYVPPVCDQPRLSLDVRVKSI